MRGNDEESRAPARKFCVRLPRAMFFVGPPRPPVALVVFESAHP